MQNTRYLEELILSRRFRFNHLAMTDIDNQAVAQIFSDAILREEYCLFANTVADGGRLFPSAP